MVAVMERAAPTFNAKNKAEPVLTLLAKTGPGDSSTQQQTPCSQARFLEDFTAHAGDIVLVRLYSSAQAIILAKMNIIWSFVAMDHQYLFAIGRKYIAQRC